MRFIGNLIWFILGGEVLGLLWLIAGLLDHEGRHRRMKGSEAAGKARFTRDAE